MADDILPSQGRGNPFTSSGNQAGTTVRTGALRGATTVDEDTVAQVTARTQALLMAMLERNGVDHSDIISVLFTATDDIHSMFPATAARAIGFGDVPLLCARELDIHGAQGHCIRVLMHLETTRERAQLHHVYLEGARGLRDDLPE
jgi:chorismate mutase